MVDPDTARCAGCAKQLALPKLTYDDAGRLLCAKCHAAQMSNFADKVAISADEYRACEACGKKLVPELVADDADSFHTRRRYACQCGQGFWILTWPAIVMAALLGAGSAAAAGSAFYGQELDEMIVPAIVMAIITVLLVRDATIRHRNPRVL
ncbi:MAG: hypothetical protein IT377_00330 [Polyangiaceae bacterium]|nr:hypothetical protein [Polyangiaceae bacterium]